MRYGLIVLWMLFWSMPPAIAQVSVAIGFPALSIGLEVPLFPDLVRVPGYPVYYAPRLDSNFFFYDGLYWVYERDDWYASSWYSGPWARVAPATVPLYVLRVPVRYYRNPPAYFRGWQPEAPPRWDQHWGKEWEQQRSDWNNWNRSSAPAPAPLPVYQRRYAGDRYPQAEQQQALHKQNYHYQPRDTVVRQHYQEQRLQTAPPPQRPQQRPPQERSFNQQEIQGSSPPRQRQPTASAVQRAPPAQRGNDELPRPAPPQASPQQRGHSEQDHRQQQAIPQHPTAPTADRENAQHGKDGGQEPRRGRGQDKERERGEERGPERNR